jgi:hypothetical protein
MVGFIPQPGQTRASFAPVDSFEALAYDTSDTGR